MSPLKEAIDIAKKRLPGWAFALIKKAIIPEPLPTSGKAEDEEPEISDIIDFLGLLPAEEKGRFCLQFRWDGVTKNIDSEQEPAEAVFAMETKNGVLKWLVEKASAPFKNLPIVDKPWDATAAIRRVREFTGSTEKPSARYRQAFFWYDPKNADSFGAYKLPFADVVDGKLVAIRRGVFAANGAMSGARGGVDLPSGDRAAVQDRIDRYRSVIESKDAKKALKATILRHVPQKEWLDIALDKAEVCENANGDGFEKYGTIDHGEYRLGEYTENALEIFLDGTYLKGRYLISSSESNGGENWLIEDIETYDETQFQVPIAKSDPVKQIVYGVVADPYGKNGAQPDAHNDWIPPKDIEECAHEFMLGKRVIGLQHSVKANADLLESHIEQYPTHDDYLKAMRGEPHRVTRRPFGDDFVHSGSWIVGVRLGKEEWELVRKGELNAFSPGGSGIRIPITTEDMPQVTFVDLVQKVN